MFCSMRAGETSLMICAIAGSRPVFLCVLLFSSAVRAGGRAPDLRALVWATVADGSNIRRAIAAAKAFWEINRLTMGCELKVKGCGVPGLLGADSCLWSKF